MEHSTSVSQRLTAILLCICLLMSLIPFSAPRGYASRDGRSLIGEIGGYLHGSLQTIQKTYAERKFTAAQGHGFAAERANNLFDVLHGEKAVIIGDNNAKNGADRKIINRDGTTTYIQDKYYSTASGSVNAAFDTATGEYRYLTSDGTAMWLEVPYDQYDDALQLMQKKISDGKVPGVSDPSEAANYVRQGKYTYKQAQNIVKAGNIDSLKYDATNGIITAIGSFGISFALDFVSCKMNGESFKDATKNAALNGLKTGGFVFATYVISSQLAKTGLRSALKPTTDAIANALGNGVSSAILGAFGENASALTASQIAAKVSAILQNQIITSGVIVVALSASDVVDLFCGRISKEQLLKNLIVTVSSVAGTTAGGIAGGAVGSALLPGVGTAVGTFVGGMAGGAASGYISNALLSKVYAGDAQQMYDIISEQFHILSADYLISEKEGAAITERLQATLNGDTLKEMYSSEDRESFAVSLMEPLFEEQVQQRSKIVLPTEDEVRTEMKTSLQEIVYIH